MTDIKPYYICMPGDIRLKKYGWTEKKFTGYLSLVDNTVWLSAIWSLHPNRHNLSHLIKNLHKAGFEIKVPTPLGRMEEICKHLGFVTTKELFPEAGEMITVMVLKP
jgi:hypothetical protein